ncbi:TerC family protein [Pleomorphovibrio marinus]|uniref:TerC family protein n=1 Tax=Pleomorphovibrio marinus TaxID=2164132 RepID=UPI000E0AC009|nr:TerC family protein [Pleomorphovibrio marinus]
MELFLQTETWIALLTLTFLEIVLGVDNIIFISIISNKLPHSQQAKARNLGLGFALLFRILLLLGISWVVQFTQPLLEIFGFSLSLRDLILIVGGLFLLFKSTMEIHHKMEGKPQEVKSNSATSPTRVILQIILLDIIFSFDSILTAVGLVNEVSLMIIAVVVAMVVMMVFSGSISRFINGQPTLQILALSFLLLIGFMLMVEGFHVEIPKGYIYFAVFFSLGTEIVNMKMRKNAEKQKVKLNPRFRKKVK